LVPCGSPARPVDRRQARERDV